MLPTSRSKPVGEPPKILFVYLVEDRYHGLLNDLVLQGRDSLTTSMLYSSTCQLISTGLGEARGRVVVGHCLSVSSVSSMAAPGTRRGAPGRVDLSVCPPARWHTLSMSLRPLQA